MNFIIYDIVLLILFVIFVSLFLYSKRKNLKREGLLYLYRTQLGIKLINYIGKKYKKTLKALGYFSIFLGYLLMIGIIYLSYHIVKIYLLEPAFVKAIKIPPIMPIIPYIDKVIPGLPPFYFIYFIIILAIIAIPHEFAHGIFMKRYNVKIKSTGFGFFPFFFPVFLAAFVEQDEKSLERASKLKQMAILSAGTFANVLTAIFFFIIIFLFFSLAFTPSGVIYDDYAYNLVNISSITMMNGVLLKNPSYEVVFSLIDENRTFQEIKIQNQNYVGFKKISSDGKYAYMYYDSPAIKTKLENTILKIEEEEVTSIEELSKEINNYSPGERVTLTIKDDEGEPYNMDIVLGENPENKNAWLGISFSEYKRSGLMGRVVDSISSFKESHIYYESRIGSLGSFIYNLLWWIILISVSVALINMLPVGIFDGGRFFYLTILGITKSKKKAERAFKFITYFFLLILLLLMIFWIISFK
jgi:membrane-associated protease RseP (regulator of RpoE activity)